MNSTDLIAASRTFGSSVCSLPSVVRISSPPLAIRKCRNRLLPSFGPTVVICRPQAKIFRIPLERSGACVCLR